MKLSPRKAKNFESVCKLNSDNFDTKNYWIIANENHITITEQTSGENAKASISFDRNQFNKLIDWYNRKQLIIT